jgi:beta-lactamase regulating signal transducer with metallopeptidase domain/uncharacterized membrane protein YkoI
MEKYMLMIAAASLVMSVVILGLLLFNKLFAGRYSAKCRYYIWLAVLIGLLVPFRPEISLPFEPVQVLEYAEQPNINNFVEQNAGTNNSYNSAQPTISENRANLSEETTISFSKTTIVFFIWLIGVILTFAFYIWCHKRFTAMVKRWGIDITDPNILSALRQAKAELNIPRKIRLKECSAITSPMLTGFVKPVILLPATNIHEDDLLLILKHELIHYKRRDLWINLLVILTTAVHWFNPVVHLMANAIRNDCETSCDEAVLGNVGEESRRLYGEAIIGFIGTKKAVKTALSTNFYGGMNTMKKRIMSIMDTGKKKTRIAVLCVILVLSTTFLSGFVFSVGNSPDNTPDKVLEAVLAKTGGGTVVKCELDYLGNADSGIRIYEIEIINGGTKYEIEIGVDDLIIYGFEESTSAKDRSASVPLSTDITADKAVEIALAQTNGGEVMDWEFNSKNRVYKVEIVNGDTEYSMNVGAADGAVTNLKEKAIKAGKVNKSEAPASQPILISSEEAKAIALERAGGGIVDECELDYEKGVWVYEIEVKDGKTEYEVEINAETGEIIKFEIDD